MKEKRKLTRKGRFSGGNWYICQYLFPGWNGLDSNLLSSTMINPGVVSSWPLVIITMTTRPAWPWWPAWRIVITRVTGAWRVVTNGHCLAQRLHPTQQTYPGLNSVNYMAFSLILPTRPSGVVSSPDTRNMNLFWGQGDMGCLPPGFAWNPFIMFRVVCSSNARLACDLEMVILKEDIWKSRNHLIKLCWIMPVHLYFKRAEVANWAHTAFVL